MSGRHAQSGFSLMEVLVVAAIVSLLAALAIPRYVSYRSQAADTMVQSSLHHAASAMEGYHSEHDATYAGASTDGLVTEHGLRLSDGLTLAVVAVPDRYWVIAEADGGTGAWTLISETGRIQRLSTGSGARGGNGNGNRGGRSDGAPGKQRAPGQNR